MRKSCSIFISVQIFLSLFCVPIFAEQKFNISGGVVSQPPAQTKDNDQDNGNRPKILDCARPTSDPRCKASPYYYPYYPSYGKRSRPVIINQLPAQPALDINSLTDDWDSCRKAKLAALKERNGGDRDQANRLEEWLWKNCRSYSNELRELEQNDM